MSKESTPSSDTDPSVHFLHKRHEKFLLRLLDILPGDRFASLETSRMTLLFFAVSGLDVLGVLHSSITEERKREIIDWIYSLQVENGFLGSTFFKAQNSKHELNDSVHIAMTYTALATLVILGDDLTRTNSSGILSALHSLQNPDGSFMASKEEKCCDMRFVYCAATICTILNDFEAIDVNKVTNYILKSQTFEGAFGQGPNLEAHGGSTYCAVASLSMLGKLKGLEDHVKEKCLKWCVLKLDEGFHGRPNKQDDTCYTFWIGATLKLLAKEDFDAKELILKCVEYVLSTQDGITGGLAKWPDLSPDPLHTYLGLSGLALAEYSTLMPVDPELNVTIRARAFLNDLRNKA